MRRRKMQLPKKVSGSGRRSTASMVLVSVSVALTSVLMAALMTRALEDHHFVVNATDSTNATLSSSLSSPVWQLPPIEERARSAVNVVVDAVVGEVQRVLGCIENGYPVCAALCYPYDGKCVAAPIELTLTLTTTDSIPPRCACSMTRRPDACSSNDGFINCLNRCAKLGKSNGECQQSGCHCYNGNRAYAIHAPVIQGKVFAEKLCQKTITGTEIPLCEFACSNGLKGDCKKDYLNEKARCICPIKKSDGTGREFERNVAETNLLYPPTMDPCEIDGLQDEQRVAACGALCPKAISRGHCSSIVDELGVEDPTAHYCVCAESESSDSDAMRVDGVSPYFLPIVSGKPTTHGKTLYHGANRVVFHFAQPCHGYGPNGSTRQECHHMCPHGTTGMCLMMSIEWNAEFTYCLCRIEGALRYWTLNIARKVFPNASSNKEFDKEESRIRHRAELAV